MCHQCMQGGMLHTFPGPSFRALHARGAWAGIAPLKIALSLAGCILVAAELLLYVENIFVLRSLDVLSNASRERSCNILQSEPS